MKLDDKRLKDKARAAMHKLKDNVKGTYYSMADIPSSSVQELAVFIQLHPESHVTKKNLLGNAFSLFRLNLNRYDFYLETRSGRILQLDGSKDGKRFVSYRSYRDADDLHSPVKLS
ncbi:hypothetical protein NQ095_06550 [Rossellomorea sp. SC111]|uniref:hypothetical protein n=1 Tax=Rossellomorea sp. SC111 TaxID=2968985 RepID=UPI00215A1B32|nr:hypothetical protein [Rossellomorea sp. SC111]MCR8848061.1 hypothetical protein [Rossellomorea sp. SC111]